MKAGGNEVGNIFKPSFYNFFYEMENEIILYNSLTNGLAVIEKKYAQYFDASSFDIKEIPNDEVIQWLIEEEFFVEDGFDELSMLKYNYNLDKYDRKNLGLTIAPTLNCNYKCVYCYEQGNEEVISNTVMTEEVQNSLIDFIGQQIKFLKHIDITWFGGEPCLAIEVVENLSRRILELAKINMVEYTATMVTNGYYIANNSDIVEKFKELKINSCQITLDGTPIEHNKRRLSKREGENTFAYAIKAIEILNQNDITVDVRINVDSENTNSVHDLLDIFKNKNLEHLNYYLGHLIPYTEGCSSLLTTGLSKKEFAECHKCTYEYFEKNGFRMGLEGFYPYFARPCIANRVDSLVIDPMGNIYKCRTELGNLSKSCGNICRIQEQTLLELKNEFEWINWSPFEFDKCQKCKYLPICLGGCAYVARYIESEPQCDECKYYLEHYLRKEVNKSKLEGGQSV
jgi:uncharacterized protein